MVRRRCLLCRAVDPHSIFADPDPAVFLRADPDPAAFLMRIRILLKQICKKNLPYEEFSGVEKVCSKVKETMKLVQIYVPG